MKKLLFILTLFPVFSFSQNLTYQWLESKPKSLYKDFYIWQYLKQDITSDEALNALGQVKYFGPKIFEEFTKKYDDPLYKEYQRCLKLSPEKLIEKNDYCIEAGLSIYDATKLTKDELQKAINKTENSYPQFSEKLKVLTSKNPFKVLINGENELFYALFNECGSVYREKHFNKAFSKELFSKLKKEEKEFDRMIKRIVTNTNMDIAQKSLLFLDPQGLSFETLFFLAINALKFGEEQFALNYFNEASKKAYFQMEKDNITFWQYLITKNQKYLDSLSKSWDVNIYSLYALEKRGKTHQNIIYDINLSNQKSPYDTGDPFSWMEVLDKTKKIDQNEMTKLEKLFSDDTTLPHLAFVKERFERYKKSYFITPFKDTVSLYDTKRQALIYAIARQESRFIPSSISFAYAMGTMQIMPFLSKSIAKELKEPYDIFDQLDPRTNIRYADHHLNYLEKRLEHPLLIAYAYNGGIGFTKRSLKQGLFKKGKYEPFLSMELLQFDETKKYGKKVLANYYIYHNLLNEKKIKLSDLLSIENKL